MKKGTIVYIICYLSVICGNAQNSVAHNIVGTNHLIKSKVLNEERQIQIYLPVNYEDSKEHYPVLYVLDGQRLFNYAVSLSQSFKQFQLTPDFIVVGIYTEYPKRFQQLGEGKDTFIKYLSAELIPYLNKSFRTNNENLIFGWEYGASLVFNTMLSNPTLFDAHIMASAFPIMDAIDKLNDVSALPTNLYFSVSPDEYDVKHSAVKLDSLLTQKNIKGLKWSFLKLDIEQHRSTGYPTLYHGLRNYYKYYQEFEVNNLQKFINAGGIDYAYQYTKERAKRHGFSPELGLWSKFTIIRSAMRADDFYHFETLLNALNKKGFINELMNSNMGYVVSDFASFYEKHNHFKEAIDFYNLLLKKYPDSEKLLKKKARAISTIKKK
ncbi:MULTISPECIES: alpha/beta hydrolase-fold protein [Maribacter]|uniref:Alpha/beta hydrolase-fold protein n=1 Tax=Maribacter flavus TaxID=1658664 RepID=A0ABU7IGK6_9FLAO|nr:MULTISPECIES: alpha/beta hydrolase-fold protein [Maribacter]MDC6404652.1 alpha/beta hydrolase-fold protein [Maribacter sp. PR66]MEE1972066.1 alpha/beta hydrolase-fold protein [Maribacter flavus]